MERGKALFVESTERRIVRASRYVDASARTVFELLADPAQHSTWDGNGNLADAPSDQRVNGIGDVFIAVLSGGSIRENHVVEFDEGRLIAWMPAERGAEPIGHLWRWHVEEAHDEGVLVTHVYDWTNLHDERRHDRARWTTSDRLAASIDGLAILAEVFQE